MAPQPLSLYSIGHSNHSIEQFLSLLAGHRVELVIDVRSSPRSRYAPQFNQQALAGGLASVGIGYLFLGAELGGRPEGDEFYDAEGHVLYSEVAATSLFESGIERLDGEASAGRVVAMMCSEEDPTDCHRRLLVTRVLTQRGVPVEHIRGDGRLQSENELSTGGPQQALFLEEAPWRSTRSVSHRRPRATSSAG